MSNRKKSDKWVLTVVDEDQNGNAILRPYANYDNEMIGRLKKGRAFAPTSLRFVTSRGIAYTG
jgi:hypothetical protein